MNVELRVKMQPSCGPVLSHLAASCSVALIFTGNPFVCRARWQFHLTPYNVSAAAAAAEQVSVWWQRAWCVDLLCFLSG
jgi:hypothetical protein